MPKQSKNVINLLNKSKESALLAVEIYNKPRITFRSGAYITLMVIAWTSLLEAIFEKNNTNYHYKKGKRYVRIDGDRKTWELQKCIDYYFNNNKNDSVYQNLCFFSGLRNKIEHRFMPSLDYKIYGECQALLLNFENILTKEFGIKHSISGQLVFSLQFSKFNQQNRIKQDAKFDNTEIIKYIDDFRNSLDEKMWSDEKFSFRVYLIPKLTNNRNQSDIAVEFIKYDPQNIEEMEKYKHLVTFIKEKEKIVQVANQGKYKPGQVVKRVSKKLNKKFTQFMHSNCYKLYKVRPEKNSINPLDCNVNYCQYDVAHKDYIYTEDWINFLITELSDDTKYDALKAIKRKKE